MVADLTLWLQRLDPISVLDILLVALFFFGLLTLVRGTRAVQLLRGIILVVLLVTIISSVLPLQAFGWLLRNLVPWLAFAVPVIFAPELRRGLERLGRASTFVNAGLWEDPGDTTIGALAQACQRLAEKRLGALVVLERETGLQDYIDSGVAVDSVITPELLMTIFYTNTPLHDGAVIVRNGRVAAAACVLPLSVGGILADRQMGLRHRAALGVSEISDAVAVVVSEQTGQISVAHNGRMIRRLDAARLQTILRAFHPARRGGLAAWRERLARLRSLRRAGSGPGGTGPGGSGPDGAGAGGPGGARAPLPRRENDVEWEESLR
jgi:diadenylate cyclase